MPLFSQIHRDWFVEPLVAVTNLGAGGDAITISKRLHDAGVRSATTLGELMRRDPRHEVLSFGHVFSSSMHHYLLRDSLASGKIDPDRDVRLRIFPPNQMAVHMQRGTLDGFCVGEPWNTLAEQSGAGQIAAVTPDILPSHPEKVLAVTRRWMETPPALLVPMIRAILRASAFCEDEHNADLLTELLARPEYLNTPEPIIRQSLALDRTMSQRNARGVVRRSDWRVRSFASGAMFPSKTHSAWLATQMLRWKHLPPTANALALADRCADSAAFREAAATLGIACPVSDFPTMPLRNDGVFDPAAAHSIQTTTTETVERARA